MPAPLLTAVYGTFVAAFCAVISAPGITAPLESVISPLICAFEVRAFACGKPNNRIAAAIPTVRPRRDATLLQIDFMTSGLRTSRLPGKHSHVCRRFQ